MFNYIFRFGLPGKCLYKNSYKTYTFLVPAAPAPDTCIFGAVIKTWSWKSNMTNVK